MPTFSLAQLTDKNLYAKQRVNARSGATVDSTLLYTFKPGEFIGTIYSVVNRPDGQWLQIDRNIGGLSKTFFVKASAAGLDLDNLRDQGALTTTQERKQAEEAAKTPGEKAFDLIKKVGIVTGVAFTVFQFAKMYRETRRK